jgi:hypothetical protein
VARPARPEAARPTRRKAPTTRPPRAARAVPSRRDEKPSLSRTALLNVNGSTKSRERTITGSDPLASTPAREQPIPRVVTRAWSSAHRRRRTTFETKPDGLDPLGRVADVLARGGRAPSVQRGRRPDERRAAKRSQRRPAPKAALAGGGRPARASDLPAPRKQRGPAPDDKRDSSYPAGRGCHAATRRSQGVATQLAEKTRRDLA